MKTIFAKSIPGRHGWTFDSDAPKASDMLPTNLLRRNPPKLPECTELDVVRHFTQLSRMNYSVDANFYPLGSCTMKYNPKFTEYIANLRGFSKLHPLLAQLNGGDAFTQGALQCLYDAERWLCELTGMSAFTFQPMAGANGEFTGVKLIDAYHKAKNRTRKIMLVPDAAHGTNPASATLAGFTTINITSQDGMVAPQAVAAAISEYGDNVAGMMMTCPNTLGLMEIHLPQIVNELRKIDALLYYDGANLNSIMGRMRPGDVGFDVVHLNVHKTLGTPHGGGGPGAGPVGASEKLRPYLPVPRIIKRANDSYALDYNYPESIGSIGPFYGSFGVIIKALAYMLRLGGNGLKRASDYAVLNANYIKKRLENILDVPFANRLCAHEFVASAPHGMHALDMAKGLLERGIHAPTIYFPMIVNECLMCEPTECESKETLDAYVDALTNIAQQGQKDPESLKQTPYGLPVRRPDETTAAREMILVDDSDLAN